MRDPRPTLLSLSLSLSLLLAMAPGLVRGEEVRTLFNGKDLAGWVVEGNPGSDRHDDGRPVWTATDGLIHCAGKGFGFLRYDREQFADFTLHVAFRMAPKCNSGVGIRTRVFDPEHSRETRPSIYSYEIQLIDDGKPPSKTSCGSLYRYVAPRRIPMKPAGEWNELVVTCAGPRIRVDLNGETIQDVDQTTVDALKAKPLKGYVCLQNHGGTIDFRDVWVKPLAAAGR